jgi:hypothetical protein
MTAASLKRIVEEALAEVGANVNFLLVPKGKARSTKSGGYAAVPRQGQAGGAACWG